MGVPGLLSRKLAEHGDSPAKRSFIPDPGFVHPDPALEILVYPAIPDWPCLLQLPMEPQQFSISKRLKSFKYAFSGIRRFFWSEHNARIHLLATLLVITASIFFKVSFLEGAILALTIALVWVAEIFNTCLEKAMDFISTERHDQIKFIKDLAAGAVLLASVCAVIVGLFIFIPKLI